MLLLIDPHSRRVVYMARDGNAPDKVVIVVDGRQLSFVPSACDKIEYSGRVPDAMDALNCWNFRFEGDEIKPLANADRDA